MKPNDSFPGRVSLYENLCRLIALRGFSDCLFTSSLHYVWRNFRARVDYRYRADYIEGLDASAIEDEWFAAVSRSMPRWASGFERGSAFLPPAPTSPTGPQVSCTGTKVFPEDVSYSGRKYTFGAEYRF